VLSEYAKSLESRVKERYSQKVSIIGVDPASITAEQFSPECLPPVEISDLLSYLVLETSFYTNKQFKAFKSLEAFNQMLSGFVTSVVGKVITGKYVVRASVRHSQHVKDPIVNIWVISENDADALSRVSPQPTPKEGEDEEDFIPVHVLTEELPSDSTRIGDFRRATAEDTTFGLLMQVVANVWPELKKDCHPLLADYWTYREEISAENGPLFKGHRLIVPEKFRSRVLQTIHERHFGFDKMQLRAREAVFWPGITSDLLQTAQSCEVCQTFTRSQQRETVLLHEVPQEPWEKLGIDFFEFRSTTYLLIADYYSRFPMIRKLRSTITSATNEILKQVFSEYGVPEIRYDRQWPPILVKGICSLCKPVPTSIHY